MKDRVTAFMDAWTERNLAFAREPREETAATMEADDLAESCVVEAEAVGITREDLEAEYGDLVAYMQGKLDEEVA